jgi:PBSX family phage portal protein
MEHSRRAVEDDDDSHQVVVKLGTESAGDTTTSDIFMGDGKTFFKVNGLSPASKRKITRLEKAYVGQAGTKTHAVDPLAVNGYSIFEVVIPPYNLEYLARIYEINAAHHAAVNVKVANVVGLGYEFKETNRTLDKIEDVLDEQEKLGKLRRKLSRAKSDLREYIESLNYEDSFGEVMKKVLTDYEATGNGYIEIGRTSTGKIGYIGHIPSHTMRVRRYRDGFIQIVYNKYTFFRNFGDTEMKDPMGIDDNPNEVIHLKKYTPTNTFYGIPDIVSATTAIAGDEFASKFNIDYFENKAVPRYIIVVKGAKLTPDSERKLLEFFHTGLKGKNHRTLYIPLPADNDTSKVEFKMEPVEAGIQDSSFKNYRRENRDQILMAHRVPISKVGMPEGVSLASARDADKTFKEQVCRPTQDFVEDKVNMIIKEFTDVFVLRFNELTLTDEDTQSKIDERYLRTQVLMPNDVRSRKGLPPRPGGDGPLVLNAQAQAEQRTQTNGNRRRDQERSANSPDQSGEARNPKGEGRQVA